MSLASLQVQIQNLLNGVGGAQSMVFLDLLAELGEVERARALEIFTAVLRNIINGDKRALSDRDKEQRAFVESLTNEIVRALKDHQGDISDFLLKDIRQFGSDYSTTKRGAKVRLVTKKNSTPVDISKFRRLKNGASATLSSLNPSDPKRV